MRSSTSVVKALDGGTRGQEAGRAPGDRKPTGARTTANRPPRRPAPRSPRDIQLLRPASSSTASPTCTPVGPSTTYALVGLCPGPAGLRRGRRSPRRHGRPREPGAGPLDHEDHARPRVTLAGRSFDQGHGDTPRTNHADQLDRRQRHHALDGRRSGLDDGHAQVGDAGQLLDGPPLGLVGRHASQLLDLGPPMSHRAHHHNAIYRGPRVTAGRTTALFTASRPLGVRQGRAAPSR